MHFEVLVEDASGKLILKHLLEKILGPEGAPHTVKIHAYKGIGRLPRWSKSAAIRRVASAGRSEVCLGGSYRAAYRDSSQWLAKLQGVSRWAASACRLNCHSRLTPNNSAMPQPTRFEPGASERGMMRRWSVDGAA